MKLKDVWAYPVGFVIVIASAYNLVFGIWKASQHQTNWTRSSALELIHATGKFELGLKKFYAPYRFVTSTGSILKIYCDPYQLANACLDYVARDINERQVDIAFWRKPVVGQKPSFDLIMSVESGGRSYVSLASRLKAVQSFNDLN